MEHAATRQIGTRMEYSKITIYSLQSKIGRHCKGQVFDVYTPQALNRKQLLPDKENTEKFKCV